MTKLHEPIKAIGRPATFPAELKAGDYVFFVTSYSPQHPSLYGKIRSRKLDKFVVDLSNSSSTMTVDPKTGVAKPYRGTVHRLVWICSNEELNHVKGYNELAAMVQPLIQREYERTIAGAKSLDLGAIRHELDTEPEVTKEQFLTSIEMSTPTEAAFDELMRRRVCLRCYCGDHWCRGWAMIVNEPDMIAHHQLHFGAPDAPR